MPNVEIAGAVRCRSSPSSKAAARWSKPRARSGRRRSPTSGGCSTTRRSTPSRSPRPTPPHAADDLGVPGRQGRLRREAVLAQHVRGAADRRGGAEVQPHRAARHQSAQLWLREAQKQIAGRHHRRRLHGARPRASSGATPSAARRRSRCRRASHYDLWTGPAPEQAVHAESLPLQLALALGLRQRRHRQPGRPSDGHRRAGASA